MVKAESRRLSVIMIGATGAVGSEVVRSLLELEAVQTLTLLGRRKAEGVLDERVVQEVVDLADSSSYGHLVEGHDVAICTVGVGQPSKMSKADFERIDKDLPLDFARASRRAEVKHFQLLGSVGSNARSRSFFLRKKGELQDELIALKFDRLSLFQPSMILTPENRYGWQQGLTLKVWPWLSRLMIGPLAKFRGVPVRSLGDAFARNVLTKSPAVQILQWSDFAVPY